MGYIKETYKEDITNINCVVIDVTAYILDRTDGKINGSTAVSEIAARSVYELGKLNRKLRYYSETHKKGWSVGWGVRPDGIEIEISTKRKIDEKEVEDILEDFVKTTQTYEEMIEDATEK